MRGFASGQKVLRSGLDDGTPLSRATTTDAVWLWTLVSFSIRVPSAGIHVIRVLRKDPNVELDKIMVTPSSLKRTGMGPAESPRD